MKTRASATTTYQKRATLFLCYAYLMRFAGTSAEASKPSASSSLQETKQTSWTSQHELVRCSGVHGASLYLGVSCSSLFILTVYRAQGKVALFRQGDLSVERQIYCRLRCRYGTKLSGSPHTTENSLYCRCVPLCTLSNNKSSGSSSSSKRKMARADRNNRSLQEERRLWTKTGRQA